MDMFRVLRPGSLTTVQDLGRYGFQRYGIPVSGALDRFAFSVANLLVGNPENAAALEVTFTGPKFEVLSEGLIAVTGADVPVAVNGEPQRLWESFPVKKGDVISVRTARAGVRAYIAVGGGIDVPQVMGSRSTCLRGGFGGTLGRALVRGDLVRRCPQVKPGVVRSLPTSFKPTFHKDRILRVVPGPQDDWFDKGIDLFYKTAFTVTPEADRTGYRLNGPMVPFATGVPTSIISEPSLAGSVQVPPDGKPIILLVELTVGGYAKIATVITPDLDLVAQARPGDTLRFSRISMDEAFLAHLEYRDTLQTMRLMLT